MSMTTRQTEEMLKPCTCDGCGKEFQNGFQMKEHTPCAELIRCYHPTPWTQQEPPP
jgi:hypothetical protein